MGGWNAYKGELKKTNLTEAEYDQLFAHFFSKTVRKTTSYKYAYLKAIIESVDMFEYADEYAVLTLKYVFEQFTKDYWKLVLIYGIKQKRGNGNSSIENVLINETCSMEKQLPDSLQSLDRGEKDRIVQRVVRECNRYVTGALYEEFQGMLFSFDLQKSPELVFDKTAVEYMIKNKRKLLNSDLKAWAMFLEEIEDESKAIDIAQKMGFNYIESRVNIYWLLLSTLFNEDLG